MKIMKRMPLINIECFLNMSMIGMNIRDSRQYPMMAGGQKSSLKTPLVDVG
jgi:hypothetical protein